MAGRKLDILPDVPDIRDCIYSPSLRPLAPVYTPRQKIDARNQGEDASCTGFALAQIIDFLRNAQTTDWQAAPVSARMLYEMAKRNDEWQGSAYEGSSLRGALKGLFRNGVCSEKLAPDQPGVSGWNLTYEMAKEARQIRLGAYYRLRPDLTDYHAAINEVGIIYVSAQIHSNWDNPADGIIRPGGASAGGHAFAIVGYDEEGFLILNSWGPDWGRNGLARWSYADWMATVMDAWVLQLGVRAPAAFGLKARETPGGSARLFGIGDPTRNDILGHFINIDDGRYVEDHKYASPKPEEMLETVKRLTMTDSNGGAGYNELMIYAHGGLNDLSDEAKRIAAWHRADIFGRNGIYNFHLMWGTGLLDEVFGRLSASPLAGAGGAGWTDWMFETGLGKAAGTYAWRNMKQDSRAAFGKDPAFRGGIKGLRPLLSGLDKAAKRPRIHLVGHSAGSILLGHLLSAWNEFKLTNLELASVHLMAPACTTAFFDEHYTPYLKAQGHTKLKDKIYLYNLTDQLEQDDTVSTGVPLTPTYSRSLLYLVSRAFEEKAVTPLAGMEIYRDKFMPKHSKLDIALSATGGETASKSHGGFDNDVRTLTTIMKRIAGVVKSPPRPDELTGY